jgi:hypothetical protein
VTKAEKQYMGKVAEIGCILCKHLNLGETPAELHHPRTGIGAGRRASHMDVIPLCPEHHRGNSGLHGMGRKAFEKYYGIEELELLEKVKECLR